MQAKELELKGLKNGILVALKEGPWDEQEEILLQQIDDNQSFFEGGKLVVDVGSRTIKSPALASLRNALSDRSVKLWAVLSSSEVTERAAQDLGLAVTVEPTPPEPEILPINSLLDGEEAAFFQRTLRSGHKIKFPGHVVILGDVNPGAEIVAGGNIIVWGKLRGLVHAGAAGNQASVVCALDLAPTQLRIAEKISISPTKKGKTGPEIAQLVDGQVTARVWKAGSKH